MSEMPTPWTPEQRAAKKRKLDKDAERAAARLGVRGVYMLAFFDAGDGQHFHIIDGGTSPMSLEELHKTMLGVIEKLKLSGGAEVIVQ